MSKLTIKLRLYLLAFVPLILVVSGMVYITHIQISELNETEITLVREQLFKEKQNELKSYMQIVDSVLEPLKQSNAPIEDVVKELSLIKFGESGYIFGYNSKGIRIVQGNTTKGIGDSFWNLQDSRGTYLIQDIIKKAKSGGGYTSYFYPKPGETEAEEKLSYSIYANEWDLIIGTGFYIDDVEATIAEMEEISNEATSEGFEAIGIFSLIIAMAVALISYFITLGVLKPLKQFDDSIASFARGDADLTARMDDFKVPEFAKLSNNFNTFVADLQGIVKRLASASDEIASETTSIQGRADKAENVSGRQREETEQVATAMTEMTTTAQEISQSATSAASSATVADERARDAMNTVGSAVTSVEALADKIEQAGVVMQRLEGNVKNISSSLDVIQEIAEQTNLLALNAAIEAARAGDQGRGFAVVADEVRQLASRTQASTGEINEAISLLKSATDEAVAAMHQSKDQSQNTVSQASLANKALEDIVNAVETIMEMNTLIATATEEQTQVGQEISERVVTISDQSANAASIAEENKDGCNSLRNKVDDLNQVVDQFTV